MAIPIDFINFLCPIKTIERKYPGGWEQCKWDHAQLMRGRVWYDHYLFRNGAMNPVDMNSIVKRWERKGFIATELRDGKQYWLDFCVFEEFSGSDPLCDWLIPGKGMTVAHIDDPDPDLVMCLPRWTRRLEPDQGK